MNDINAIYPENKSELYGLINAQLKALLENENKVIPNLANASALLSMALKDINWAGFYLLRDNELFLGPFQGKPACIHIPIGKGVCGKAVAENKTMLVPDVHAFPGHIACDSASRSEIVIPLQVGDRIVGVLDIDSPILSRFDAIDKEGLEEFAGILVTGCDWSGIW